MKNRKAFFLFFILFNLICFTSYSKVWNFRNLQEKGIDNSFLCYMDGRYITDPTSPQYSFIKGVTPMKYGIYNKSNHYLVAVSPIYGKIGDEITITFKSGNRIIVYIGDYKKTSETKKIGYGIHPISATRGCQVEFIVDEEKIPNSAKRTGNFAVSIPRYSGGILEIENKKIQ